MKCVIDLRREADRPLVCDPCRRGLASDLRELVDAYAVLSVPAERPPSRLLVEDDGSFDGPTVYDVLDLGSGPVRAPNGSARVSGSREAPVPVSLDLVDLTLPAREGSRSPHARGVLGLGHPAGLWEADDQAGYLSVATELDTWVRDWISYPWCPGDHLPVPTVVTLVGWLSVRVDIACDRHEGIDEFAGGLRSLLRACQRAVGDVAPHPEYLDGVPCSRCDLKALARHPGSDYRAECGSCGKLYTEDEYERWVGLLAAQVRAA